MNKEQIIDEAYENYCNHFMDEYLEKNELGESYRNSLIPHPIEQFINKIKTDPEFSEQWGLKIEERELSLEERKNLYFKLNPEFRLVHENMDEQMDKHNIPTKLITITYKDKTIESYE